jgi:hypothetical protein
VYTAPTSGVEPRQPAGGSTSEGPQEVHKREVPTGRDTRGDDDFGEDDADDDKVPMTAEAKEAREALKSPKRCHKCHRTVCECKSAENAVSA